MLKKPWKKQILYRIKNIDDERVQEIPVSKNLVMVLTTKVRNRFGVRD